MQSNVLILNCKYKQNLNHANIPNIFNNLMQINVLISNCKVKQNLKHANMSNMLRTINIKCIVVYLTVLNLQLLMQIY